MLTGQRRFGDNLLRDKRGIAIGPILFVIAILGLLATVIASNMGEMSNTGTIDRIAADVQSQANLIRTKINQCYEQFGTDRNYDGYPSSGGVAVDVSTLTCEGDAVALGSSGNLNIWTGPRPATLPAPSVGLHDWMYINPNTTGLGGSATDGRCIYTYPTASNPATVPGIVQGLTKSASKFNSQTSCDNGSTPCTGEVLYNPASSSQKFVMWITMPTAAPNSNCLP